MKRGFVVSSSVLTIVLTALVSFASIYADKEFKLIEPVENNNTCTNSK